MSIYIYSNIYLYVFVFFGGGDGHLTHFLDFSSFNFNPWLFKIFLIVVSPSFVFVASRCNTKRLSSISDPSSGGNLTHLYIIAYLS
uniref:Uncharacterized protein n=1 Tax=Panstrongylus lignarius TaxID=156445 RepID=A0A224XZ78_9HEMI